MKTWFIRPCTVRELAELYKLSYKVFKRHLKPFLSEIGPRNGHYYMMNQVMKIIEFLGIPPGDVELVYPRRSI